MKSKKEALFLRIEPELGSALRTQAEQGECSLNEWCSEILRRSVNRGGFEFYEDDTLVHVKNSAKNIFSDSLKSIILFGSYARGDHTSESDIDILLVLDKKVKITRKLYSQFDEVSSFSDKVSIHFVTVPDIADSLSGLWCEIALEGIVLFDRDLYVSRLLIVLRKRIMEGEYESKFSHGHRYWIHKSKEAA